jgi:hypothetical protein
MGEADHRAKAGGSRLLTAAIIGLTLIAVLSLGLLAHNVLNAQATVTQQQLITSTQFVQNPRTVQNTQTVTSTSTVTSLATVMTTMTSGLPVSNYGNYQGHFTICRLLTRRLEHGLR